ncbi:MAG: hypothetical protein CMD68_05230 [Gammaproteobacteria bacterium]|nr:hypothetical protein [Gammaproteobacteria bacterium]|tara:strand:+ start:75 stop:440 length:366 start_codon:yes stop_codon:yes gene_type:complete
MKNKLLTLPFLSLTLFLSPNLQSATVSCNFMSGEAYSISTGEWLGTAGWEDIWDIFGEGISLPMKNSLLAKLDTQEIFKAGETDKGTVYLIGGDMGVEGRLSNIEDGVIVIYSGFCDISFG